MIKEHQDPLKIDTEASCDAQIPKAAPSESGKDGEKAEDEYDMVSYLEPIGERRFIGEDISEIKWALNDAYLIVVTSSNKLFTLDSLCHSFNLILPSSNDTAAR